MSNRADVTARGRGWSAAVASLVAVAAVAALWTITPSPAAADTAPPSPTVPETVSADALPTVQINGVVWDQVIVGNRVYVTGQFSQARPAGAALGTNETPRSNLLAYDVTTGQLITSWAPSLNAQGMTIAASADGSTIFVGGDFDRVTGTGQAQQVRSRVVALNAQTGAVIAGFNPAANTRVQSLAVNGNTLYIGGYFTTMGGLPRTRLAAVNATTGALLDWTPSADRDVSAMTVHAASGRVIIGGSFTTVNGVTQRGTASLDGVSGALMPWAANTIITNSGPNTGFTDLTTDGNAIFGAGYTWSGSGSFANFEGVFSANPLTGELNWLNSCRGDTYALALLGDAIYTASHTHECGMLGFRQETNPRTWQWAMAMDKRGTPGLYNGYGSYADWNRFAGRPASQILHWQPSLSPGTYTSSGQAGWTITSNSQYVVYGGEFPRVNGVNQQGLVRFAVKEVAPNNTAVGGYPELTPVVTPVKDGTVRIEWQGAVDRDNARLTYEVLRGATVNTSTVLKTLTWDESNWWTRPPLGFVDSTAPPGSTQTYRIRVRDAWGNGFAGLGTTVAIPAGAAPVSAYHQSVLANGAFSHWRLGESGGTEAYDWANADDLTLSSAAVRGVPGALLNETDTATSWPGTSSTSTVQGASQAWLINDADPEPVRGPQVFSVEAWFRTSSNQGGKIVGFGDSRTGRSSRADRHLYLTNNGQVRFGLRPDEGARLTINSQTGLNDNQWHHVVATLSSAGARLYVDGQLAAQDPNLTKAQLFYGYWRVAGDQLSSWPSSPSREAFAGSIDEVAIYNKALTQAQVQANYNASGRTAPNLAPTAAFTSTVSYLTASFDGSTSTDPEGGALTYAWDFGDGLSGSGVNPQHTYATAGTYSVTLTVTDPATATNATVRSVTVVANAAPTAGFTSTVSNLTASFDSSTSTDPEGGALSYAWDFGDGVTSSGANPQHTYAAGGTYPVTLTVTDPASGTDTEVGSVTVTPPPNVPPTAAFSSTVSNLTASFDGSTSTDPEGGALTYDWDFGDGLTGSGANPQHTYAVAGTYPVTLTVTDPATGTDTELGSVTVTDPPNVPPSAAFTSTVSGLTASFDGSTSTDPEGGALTYHWDFGDGLSGSGASPQHSYAAAGTYPVTLTVTDPVDGTDTELASVTVTVEFALDQFERVEVNGLGTATVGGPWSLTGAASNFSVNGGMARMTGTTGGTRAGWLTQVQAADVDLRTAVSLDRAATGGGAYVSLVGRRASNGNDLRLKLQYRANGTLGAFLEQTSGGVVTPLATVTNVPGLTMAPGEVLRVRLEMFGTSPTTMRAKVWRDGTAEPSTWAISSTSVPPALLQGPGHVGLYYYTSASWTGPGAVLSMDDLSARSALGG